MATAPQQAALPAAAAAAAELVLPPAQQLGSAATGGQQQQEQPQQAPHQIQDQPSQPTQHGQRTPQAGPGAAAAAGAAAAGGAERPPGKCHFYMDKKRRYCKFDAVPGKRYCGNHLYFGEGTGPKRVPCPWDPKGGHTVLETELEKHKHKCPGYRQMLAERSQPFYCEGINAGPGPDAAWPAGLQPLPAPAQPEPAADHGAADGQAADGGSAAAGAQAGRRRRRGRGPQGAAAMAAAYAASLGEQRFEQLLGRIEAACEQICGPEPLSVSIPAEAEPFLLPESATCNRPFSMKHAQQQASIVGNMHQAGLLKAAGATTYVEYGAGKGYLSHMLCSCCGQARKVVMMDVRGFKEKADRSMRHLDMQRLRCDIADFDVAKVAGLQDGAAPWVAYGKHLCGAATDFTLRSCARERSRQLQGAAAASAGGAAAAGAGAADAGGGGGGVRGLAVATCCHHRCIWRHFVAQDVFTELGFSPAEFETIAWMTGWALCGHEAPAGFGGSDEEQGEATGRPHDGQAGAAGQRGCAAQAAGHKRGREEAGESAGKAAAAPAAAGEAAEATASAADADVAEAAAAPAASGEADWRPQWALARERRIAVGQRCKRLIDAARLHWLRRQGFSARLVKYVPSTISGENRLLLATAAASTAAAGAGAGDGSAQQ